MFKNKNVVVITIDSSSAFPNRRARSDRTCVLGSTVTCSPYKPVILIKYNFKVNE